MRFETLNVTKNVFEPGRLQLLLSDIELGKPTKDINRLSEIELERIATLFPNVPKNKNILELSNDTVITGTNGDVVQGADFKAIVKLMYTKPRSAYTKYTNKQLRSPVNSGTPIGLLGYKRFSGVPYNAWRVEIVKHVRMRENELVYSEDAVSEIFKLDLLLGKALASTYYDSDSDTIRLNPKYGLILASAHIENKYRPGLKETRRLRQKSMGRYNGHFSTQFGCVQINETSDFALLYNNCNSAMRLMLLARWAWYGMHRHDDMICDFQDWDNIPKNIDGVSTGMEGLTPAQSDAEGVNTGKGIFGV